MSKNAEKHEERNRENLRQIASRLEAIAEDRQLSGCRLRNEANEAAKPYLIGRWSPAVRKAFGELEELVKRDDDRLTDEIVRQRIWRCADSIRASLECTESHER